MAPKLIKKTITILKINANEESTEYEKSIIWKNDVVGAANNDKQYYGYISLVGGPIAFNNNEPKPNDTFSRSSIPSNPLYDFVREEITRVDDNIKYILSPAPRFPNCSYNSISKHYRIFEDGGDLLLINDNFVIYKVVKHIDKVDFLKKVGDKVLTINTINDIGNHIYYAIVQPESDVGDVTYQDMKYFKIILNNVTPPRENDALYNAAHGELVEYDITPTKVSELDPNNFEYVYHQYDEINAQNITNIINEYKELYKSDKVNDPEPYKYQNNIYEYLMKTFKYNDYHPKSCLFLEMIRFLIDKIISWEEFIKLGKTENVIAENAENVKNGINLWASELVGGAPALAATDAGGGGAHRNTINNFIHYLFANESYIFNVTDNEGGDIRRYNILFFFCYSTPIYPDPQENKNSIAYYYLNKILKKIVDNTNILQTYNKRLGVVEYYTIMDFAVKKVDINLIETILTKERGSECNKSYEHNTTNSIYYIYEFGKKTLLHIAYDELKDHIITTYNKNLDTFIEENNIL